ncbi:MAG: acylphosphatase [Burkholderiaceae bacterium]|jgi:acylphosphatase|nr:acylphosphatase [Burkholderiaceae bacterium]
MQTLQLRITGRVQGVGYRASLMDVAVARGLRGWVRNRLDGSVEAVVHGAATDCDSLVAWARRGPPAARVAAVAVTPLERSKADLPPDFECRPTA